MTPTEQIAQWVRERKEIAGKATKGEWRVDTYDDNADDGLPTVYAIEVWPDGEDVLRTDAGSYPPKYPTALHIADAHNSQSKLLAALERAVEGLDYQHSDINKCAGRLEDEACFACDTLSDIASLLGGSP